MRGYLVCEMEGGRFVMRATGQPGQARHYVVRVLRPERGTPPLDIRHYPRNRSRDVLQLFPRSRKGV